MCKSKGGNLLSLSSLDELMQIMKMMDHAGSNEKRWWVGLRETPPSSNSWEWLEAPPIFTPLVTLWDINEPANQEGNEDCGKMNQYGLLHAVPCKEVHFYICENHVGTLEDCYTGWVTIRPSCYKLSTDKLTWPRAQARCKGYGGNLLSVSSLEELMQVKKEMKSTRRGQDWWVGMRKLPPENTTWRWLEISAIPLSTRNKSSDTLFEENCVDINSEGLLQRVPCDLSLYYICEKQPAKCPAGSLFNSTLPEDKCVECRPGTYFQTPDSATCEPCPVGQFQNSSGQVNCTSCPVGSYQNATGQASCMLCPAGRYQPSEGKAMCIGCPAGDYQDRQGQGFCRVCQPGYYQDQTAQASCKRCPDGKSTSSARAIHPDNCTGSPNASSTVTTLLSYRLTITCTNEKAEEVRIAIVGQLRLRTADLPDLCLGAFCSNAKVTAWCSKAHSVLIESQMEFRYIIDVPQSENHTAVEIFERAVTQKLNDSKIFEKILPDVTLIGIDTSVRPNQCSPGFQYSVILKMCEPEETLQNTIGIIFGCLVALIAVIFLSIILFKLSRRRVPPAYPMPAAEGDDGNCPEAQGEEMRTIPEQGYEKYPRDNRESDHHYDYIAST